MVKKMVPVTAVFPPVISGIADFPGRIRIPINGYKYLIPPGTD
jgi:outer membrane usher protein FimD/PapC